MVRKLKPPMPYKSPIAIPPGETIKEVIVSKKMTQKELAQRMNTPEQEISYLINGKRSITVTTANKLELILDIKASFWLNIERNYQATLVRLEEESKVSDQEEIARQIPYNELSKYKYVDPTRKISEKVKNLFKFFQIADFSVLKTNESSIIAKNLYRKSDKFNLNPYILMTWLRMGEIQVTKLSLGKFKPRILQNYLHEIRSLTLEKPDIFVKRLGEIGQDSGVGILFVREFKSFPVWGATKWIRKNPCIYVNLRSKTNDHLWFSLFHEIGHVLLHGKQEILIRTDKSETEDDFEKEANEFASNFLIPKEKYELFVLDKPITDTKVKKFAEDIGIAPGIVVGRLQHERIIRYDSYLGGLKVNYNWNNK